MCPKSLPSIDFIGSLRIILLSHITPGYAVAQLVGPGVCGFRSPMVSLEFFIGIILWRTMALGFCRFYTKLRIILLSHITPGYAVVLEAGRSRVVFLMVSLEFFLPMALGLTQPVILSTRNIYWGLNAADNFTTFMCRLSCEPQPPGTLRACPACNGIALPLHSEPFHKMNIMSFHSKTQPQRYISTRETDDCHLAFFHCNAVNSAPRLNLRESVLQLPQSYPICCHTQVSSLKGVNMYLVFVGGSNYTGAATKVMPPIYFHGNYNR